MTTTRRAFCYTYGLDGTQTGVIADFIDLVYDWKLDDTETLTLTIPATHPHADLLVEDGEIKWKGKRFRIAQIETQRSGADVRTVALCEAKWTTLTDSLIKGTFVVDDSTAETGAAAILAAGIGNSDQWIVTGDSPATTTLYTISLSDVTVLGALRSWAKLTGTYLQWDTDSMTVHVSQSQGRDRGVGFRYGRNVTNVKRTLEPPEFTRLYAYGADDLNLASEVSVDYVEDYSFYTALGLTSVQAAARFKKSRVWTDGSYVDAPTLLVEANRRLSIGAAGVLSYEMSVVDLAELTGVLDAFAPGDSVRVADTPLGVDVRTTVVRTVERPLDPSRNSIELSLLLPTSADSSTGGSPGSTKEWLLFGKNNQGYYEMRNDATFTLNRIGLQFANAGEAMFYHELRFIGVGTGSLAVSAVDADTDELLTVPYEIPYTDGEIVHRNLLSSWLQTGLLGDKDYRIRAQAFSTATDAASGVNVEVADSKFHIFAYGAKRQTVTLPNSVTYRGIGAVQQWTVPDGIYEAEFNVIATAGRAGSGAAGKGGKVVVRRAVIPGTIFDVWVGGPATGLRQIAIWPNGGEGGVRSSAGGAGGGASFVTAEGGTLPTAFVVAGAGGGSNANGTGSTAYDGTGGDGGFFRGGDGLPLSHFYGTSGGGATQTAGGTSVTEPGDTDGQGEGGDASSPGSGSLGSGSGGGGGGWHGGGAGSTELNAGGGGSGYADYSVIYDLELDDAFSTDTTGTITISWGVPEES